MDLNQINLVNAQIEVAKKLNIERLIASIYPSQSAIGDIQIQKYKVSDFINLFNKVIGQLENELNSENKYILPYNFNIIDYGQSSPDLMLSTLALHLQSKKLARAENSLIWLAMYEVQNGFFNTFTLSKDYKDILDLSKAKTEFSLLSENYKSLTMRYEILLQQLDQQIRKASDFQEQKKNEFQQLSDNLVSSNTSNSQVQKLLNLSTQSQAKIDSILSQVDKDQKRITNTISENEATFHNFKTEYDLLNKSLSDSSAEFKKLYSDFEEKLKFVESKKEYFENRNLYLDSLIGREVGASLFETFKQRKVELEKPVSYWAKIVGLSALLTFIAIFAIFTNVFGFFGDIDGVIKWENIIVNIVKTLPFFFLLYYAISQYNKERNFQEEYAFKSAAALTIKAYSDILKHENNKDELVLKAVYGIYRSPIYNKLKANKEVNSALDLVKELVDRGSDIILKNPNNEK